MFPSLWIGNQYGDRQSVHVAQDSDSELCRRSAVWPTQTCHVRQVSLTSPFKIMNTRAISSTATNDENIARAGA